MRNIEKNTKHNIIIELIYDYVPIDILRSLAYDELMRWDIEELRIYLEKNIKEKQNH